MRFIAGLLSIVVLWAGLAPTRAETVDAWPIPPSRTVLASPYGTLSVRDSAYVYESTLMLDGAEVDPLVKGLITISYAYRMKNRSIALISVDTGDTSCPIRYHWIALRKSDYRMTEAFGSCSPKIRVAAHGHTLVLETPNADDPDKIDRWSYDGRSVKRR